MARTRYIKPGILINEDLAELGPYAYILFTGLWMIADREGRFEWRPKRIKAEVLPLWNDCDWQMVEKLLISLSEKDFIHRYEVSGKYYGQITNWRKHQMPHPREAASVIPQMGGSNGASPAGSTSSVKAMPRHVQGTEEAMTSRVGNGEWGTGTVVGPLQGCKDVENRKSTTTKKPERKQPATDDSPHQAPQARSAPHAPEAVRLIRESLKELARQIALPPPDDGIVLRVLDAGHGMEAREIHEMLVMLWKRQKFRNMQSWGLVPIVVEQCCHAAA